MADTKREKDKQSGGKRDKGKPGGGSSGKGDNANQGGDNKKK